MRRGTRTLAAGVVLGLVALLGIGTAGAEVRQAANATAPSQTTTIPFGDARLKIEFNATDGDAGLQVFLDAEPWRQISITNPQGRAVVDFEAEDVIRNFGLTELFSESSEPPFGEFPFEEFKRLFPEGTYTFRGTTIDGGHLESVFRLTHRVPDGPTIVTPVDGSVMSPNNLVVLWQPVTSPQGIRIGAYEVIVVADKPARGNPTRVFDVMLPASATRLPIAGQFLLPGSYKVEVLAVEVGGNQTLTEVAFTIR